MKIDQYGCLVMEHSSPEGNLGDSCAETSRLFHLRTLMGKDTSTLCLEMFRTEKGYVRHPKSIWREDDMSSDQLLPLALCFHYSYYKEAFLDELKSRLKENRYRTGNGDIVTPGLFAKIKNLKWLISLSVLIQLLLFKIPFRWNDETKCFERTSNSSADYLNLMHIAIYAHGFVKKLIDPKVLKEKIRHYYKPEPNSDWLIQEYDEFIDRYYGGFW